MPRPTQRTHRRAMRMPARRPMRANRRPSARTLRKAKRRPARKPEGAPVAPLLIGLTGGIAAGKSEALAAFGRLGAATISADAVVHDLLGLDAVRERLVQHWGDDVAPNGDVDRARVSELVFDRPEELAWLEAQLHPRVGRQLDAWRRELDPGVEFAVAE